MAEKVRRHNSPVAFFMKALIDGNRKRTLDDTSGEGPDTKKAFTDGLPYDVNDPKFIAQAAISKYV